MKSIKTYMKGIHLGKRFIFHFDIKAMNKVMMNSQYRIAWE